MRLLVVTSVLMVLLMAILPSFAQTPMPSLDPVNQVGIFSNPCAQEDPFIARIRTYDSEESRPTRYAGFVDMRLQRTGGEVESLAFMVYEIDVSRSVSQGAHVTKRIWVDEDRDGRADSVRDEAIGFAEQWARICVVARRLK